MDGHCDCLCGKRGEKVRVLRAEYCCFIIPTRSFFCTNCCGLFGIKSGQPNCTVTTIVSNLDEFEAESAVLALSEAEFSWKELTGERSPMLLS